MTEQPIQHYSTTAKFLHWLVAGMIVLQFVLAKLAEFAQDNDETVAQIALLANHKSVGITILLLAVVRLLWRITHTPPGLPASMPAWQRTASHVSHWSLYAFLFLMPVTGWLMSSASAYSVSWFGLVQLPDLIGPDKGLKEQFEFIHETMGKLLFLIAAVHILAALKHAIFNRDGILRRMISIPSIVAYVAVIAGGLAYLTPDAAPTAANVTDNTAPVAQAQAPEPAAASALPVWEIDSATSRIEFTGDQAGASFTGQWQQFDARIQFDAENLAQSRFDVTITTTTVDTNDSERDETMLQSDWFDAENFQQAYFRANDVARSGDDFIARGKLTIKAKSAPAELRFAVRREGERRIMTGQSTVDRLALDLGTGEWADPTWVGQNVLVRIHIESPLER